MTVREAIEKLSECAPDVELVAHADEVGIDGVVDDICMDGGKAVICSHVEWTKKKMDDTIAPERAIFYGSIRQLNRQ